MKSRLPLILILIAFFVPSAAFAQTIPPAPPEPITSAKGAAISAGWNYFTLDFDGCSAQKVLDELQADAGGGIAVDNLWVRQGDDSWQEYASVNPDSAAVMIAPDRTVALSSPGKFFFDLTAGQCRQTDPDRQNQILGLRAAAGAGSSSDESLLDRLARVPRDFWTGLTGAFKFGKADGDLEFNKTATLDRLTVTDQTNLGSTAVAGPLTVGATLIEEEGAISGMGCSEGSDPSISVGGSDPSCTALKIQPLTLGNVEFLSGKLLLTKSGDLQINSGQIAGNSSFRGSVVMPPGKGSIRVSPPETWETAPATVNLTPTWNTNVWIKDLSESGFTVNVSQPPAENSRLFWLAIW